jgi:GWxTD domain-containing protein
LKKAITFENMIKHHLSNYITACGFVLLFALLFFACNNSKKLSNSNLNSIYNKNAENFIADFLVYHQSTDKSELHFKLNTGNFLYTKKDNEKDFVCKVKLSYTLYDSYSTREIIDSATTEIVDVNNDETIKEIIGKIEFKTPIQKDYVLRILLKDMYRNVEEQFVMGVYKKSPYSSQHFLVSNPENDIPYFTHYFPLNTKVKVQFNKKLKASIYVNFTKYRFAYPLPPFATEKPSYASMHIDSIFQLYFDNQNSFQFSIFEKGYYFFQLESTINEGLTLCSFTDNYPKLESVDDILYPLRYVTTTPEYNSITQAENKKKAIDQFWLSIINNPERARELIRKYYTRVQDANTYFPTELPGWQTDRGMVYIVFGIPTTVYKNEVQETWIYGEENTYNSVTFNFIKVSSPYSQNAFRLNRSPVYKDAWYRSVDLWRQGRV